MDQKKRSGYNLFAQDQFKTKAIKDLEPKDRIREIARRWKALSAAQKEKYNKKAAAANALIDAAAGKPAAKPKGRSASPKKKPAAKAKGRSASPKKKPATKAKGKKAPAKPKRRSASPKKGGSKAFKYTSPGYKLFKNASDRQAKIKKYTKYTPKQIGDQWRGLSEDERQNFEAHADLGDKLAKVMEQQKEILKRFKQ